MTAVTLDAMRKEVIEHINNADERVVKKIYDILEAEGDADWWDELPDEIKESIDRAIEQADNGQAISHEEMKRRYPQWFTK